MIVEKELFKVLDEISNQCKELRMIVVFVGTIFSLMSGNLFAMGNNQAGKQESQLHIPKQGGLIYEIKTAEGTKRAQAEYERLLVELEKRLNEFEKKQAEKQKIAQDKRKQNAE